MYCCGSMAATGCSLEIVEKQTKGGGGTTKWVVPGCKSHEISPFKLSLMKAIQNYPSTNRVVLCEQPGCGLKYIPSYNYKQHMIDYHEIEEECFRFDETIAEEYEQCRWTDEEKDKILDKFKIFHEAPLPPVCVPEVEVTKRPREQFEEQKEL